MKVQNTNIEALGDATSKVRSDVANSDSLFQGIVQLIAQTSHKVAVSLNAEISRLYWSIGNYITTQVRYETYSQYGGQILATLSKRLTEKFGKGYTYSALTRMVKVAREYPDVSMFATLSQTLSWSHFVELASIEETTKRLFYQQMCLTEHWSLRVLRQKQDTMLYERSMIATKSETEISEQLTKLNDEIITPDVVFKSSYVLDFLGLSGIFSEKELENAIVSQLENFILELGQGFAFLERQKRMSIDSIDYYLDLLFYHRKLKRLVAIDLKLGKFKPEYKGQMELYLKYLQRYEMQSGEEKPIGLLLCSEGNTEHIELMMLDEENIKVAQFLTYLPDKQWFIDKLNKAISIAQQYLTEHT